MNSSNPYQTPSQIPTIKPSGPNVRKVAAAQRLVLFALLLNIAVNVASYAIQSQPVAMQIMFLILALAVIGFVAYAMFNLAKELYPLGMAIFFAVLMIVPCVSLIMLLVVNQKATAYLTSKNIKVGLMGANMNQFKNGPNRGKP